jgi:CheY-like chemotaxis protein
MAKTLLDCGNCGPDFGAIRELVTTNFGATVIQSHGTVDTLQILRSREVDLVTINRKLDQDYSDGLEVAKAIKADPDVGSVPVMLVSNYEEHQQAAVAAGCVPGFGKLAIGERATRQALEPYLGPGATDQQSGRQE